jgi:hypothetical protein
MGIMKLLRYPVKIIDSLVDRIVAVVGAVGGSQLPGFIQHYTQRLGGHVAEAEHNLRGWQAIADEASVDLSGLVRTYLGSPDPEVVATGQKCAADMVRVEELRAALAALQDASVWGRPVTFLKHLDLGIADATLASFSPNVPLDAEGLVYALFGLLLGLVMYLGVKQVCMVPAKRRLNRSSPPRGLQQS